MISRSERERIRQVIDSLSQVAEGQYGAKLDFASEVSPLGSVASAVNKLIERTDQSISSMDRPVDDQVLDAQRYRHILDSLEETYFETDLTGRLLFFNGRALKDLGYAREELDGLHFNNLVDEANADTVYKAFHDVFLTGRSNKAFEWEVLKKNKEIIEVESSVALMRDEDGKPVGFRGVVRDISARKQAERDLREKEEKYREIMESMEDTYLETDLGGNFIFFNDSLCRVLGYSREQLQGINYLLITPPERVQEVYRAFHEIYTTGRQKTFIESRLIANDGSAVYLEFSMSLLRSSAGEPIGFCGFGRDVTEKIKARQSILESERRLRLITDNISDIIWTMDFNLRFTYLSPSVFRVLGFTPEELMNFPLSLMVSEDMYTTLRRRLDDELAQERSGAVIDTGRITTIEMPLMHRDGSARPMEINITFNRDENGNPFEIIGVTRDIGDRKQAVQELRESEEKYRTILDSIEEGYWETDLAGRFIFCNDALCTLTGFPREELFEIQRFGLTDVESAQKTEKIFREIYRTGISGNVDEYQFTKKDGSRAINEIFVSLRRDAEGSPIGFRGVTRDVTERRAMEKALAESEQRYRMIVENMHDVIMVVGLDLTEKYRSPSAAQLTGYTLEELAGVSMKEQMPPASYALVEQVLGEELEKEFGPDPVDPHRSRMLEMEVYHKDGGTVWVEETATFLRDGDGTAVAILLAIRDITERKRLEEEKGKLEGQLMQAQKMEVVGRLAGGVAHDFNNMLSVILGYIDLAKLRLVKEHPVFKDIVEIEKAAVRSRDITSQLLAFSRKQIIAPVVVNLNDLVVNTEKALSRLIGEDIDLKIHLEEEPWMIKFDPSQIEQILINLAVNARDAMPVGGKLTIETRNVTIDESYCRDHLDFAPGHYVQLSVSDNGVGMDRETMQHIFEPFFTTKKRGEGTGLGMATVYGIVTQNNGVVTVYSEPGHGTTFKIYLPRTEEKGVRKGADEKPVNIEGGNILLVEDDHMVLEITRGMLESIGYTVIVADTPRDAITLCQDNDMPLSLVVTDVVMPVMSGKELIDNLREIRPGIKVLFMSGYTADAIAHHGVLEEGVQFLQKPFGLKELARKVREAMSVD